MTISHESYSFMTMCFRNLCQIFQMGFLYYAVFHYLIQRGHYKTPMPKNEERKMLYCCSWMLLLWLSSILLLLWIDLFHPFSII